MISMEHSSPSVASVWDRLSFDLTELILSYLPLRSLVRSSAVCHQWRCASSSSASLHRRRRRPWFFLFGLNNVVSRLDRSFGFDPESFSWVPLPPPHPDCFSGAGGFSFAASSCSRFAYSPVLSGGTQPNWRFTKPLTFPRCNPIVAVFDENRFVVVGGSRYIGGLVDLEDWLAVEIYDPVTDAWEVGSPLPVDFRSSGTSSQWLSSALLPERKMLYVFGIYSCHVAAFDLSRRVWIGGVGTLRPPGTVFAFLIAGLGDSLLLAGLCSGEQDGGSGGAQPCFAIWAVDPLMRGQPRRIAVMPRDMLTGLFGIDDDENRFASLRCVGSDGLVYVFNEDHHKGYPACVCEIQGKEMDQCSWRRIPPLPGPGNRFHKTIAFSSPVPLGPVLGTAHMGCVWQNIE
ncbi:F-box/kelch-repeat protein family [Rhynchospora pubera]|uniref:F-box/kelch-repeat protein family n=1 Tax=Rhynchospora pubera TaxID=906938 RepID=A0AAV8GEI0_9POAL|nr:F-box/kelch-repeat protein family [Rhynchospora pubera]